MLSVWFEFGKQRTCPILIWTSLQPKLKFAWWNTLQQLVDIHVTIFCWKVSRNIYRVKVFKSTTLLKRDSNTGVFLWFFFFFFLEFYFEEHLRATASGKYIYQYKCFVKHLFVIFLVRFLHEKKFKSISDCQIIHYTFRRLNKINVLLLIFENV